MGRAGAGLLGEEGPQGGAGRGGGGARGGAGSRTPRITAAAKAPAREKDLSEKMDMVLAKLTLDEQRDSFTLKCVDDDDDDDDDDDEEEEEEEDDDP